MNIRERKLHDVTIMDLDGMFVLGGEAQFKKFVDADIKSGGRKLIVNLSRVSYMDSSGIGELVAGYISMRKEGGQIKLLHLNNRVSNLLVVTKLLTVFETFDSESAALSSFTS